jgi:stress response protein SCP2
MATLKGPSKGASADLEISPQGARRFMVGLSWDAAPVPDMGVRIGKAPRKGDTAGNISYYIFWPFQFLRIFIVSFFKLMRLDRYARDMATDKAKGKEKEHLGRDTTTKHFDLDLYCYIFDANMQLVATVGAKEDVLQDPSGKVYHTGDDQSGYGSGDDEQLFVETAELPENYSHFFFVIKSDSKYSLDEFINPAVRLCDSKTDINALQSTIMPDPEMKSAYNFIFCHAYRAGDLWRFQNLDTYRGDGVDWATYLPGLLQKLEG